MSDIDLIPRTPIYISDTRRRWPGYYIEDRYKNPLEEMQAAIEDTVIKYRSDVYVPDYLIMKELVKKLLEQGIEGDLNITYTTYSQGDLLRYTAHNQQLSLEIEVLRRANRENLLKEIKVALPQYPIYFHKDPVVILMELDIQGYNFTNFVPREGKIPSYTRPSSLTCENFPDEHISIKTIPEFISQVISNPDIDDPLKLLFDINQTLQEQMQE